MVGAAKSSLRLERDEDLLRDRVVAVIRNAIFTGEFPPGMRLIERELIEQIGVSRTSVREALRHLQSESLIESTETRGLRVTVLTEAAVRHLYEVREPLESTAARLFVAHATDDEVDELARVGQKLFTTSTEQSAVDERMVAVLEFDRRLLDGARNPLLSEMHGSITARIQVLRRLSISAPERATAVAAEYEALVDAIKRRSKRSAAAAAAAHVSAACVAALKVLAAQSDQA